MPREAHYSEQPDVEPPAHASDSSASVAGGSFVPYWLLALVAALLIAVVAVGAYAATVLVARSEAENLATSGEIATWQQRVAADPSNVEAMLSLGYAYQDRQLFEDAIKIYDEALEIDARSTGALYNRGLCLLELGDADAGEQSLVAVLEISPGHALAAKALGERYLATERYALIASAVRAAAAENPEMADLHALMGVAHEHAGEIDQAMAEYREALRHAPDLAAAREGLARLEEADR
jgi:tetratricopeptide (TPR) repeat protein